MLLLCILILSSLQSFNFILQNTHNSLLSISITWNAPVKFLAEWIGAVRRAKHKYIFALQYFLTKNSSYWSVIPFLPKGPKGPPAYSQHIAVGRNAGEKKRSSGQEIAQLRWEYTFLAVSVHFQGGIPKV